MKNTSQASQAIVLFAHGSRADAWRAPFDAVLQKLIAKHPNARVELAFLEFMSPTLSDSLVAIAADGFERISIVPLFFGVGNHVARDLGELVDAFLLNHPNISITVAPALGTNDAVLDAMADYAGSVLV